MFFNPGKVLLALLVLGQAFAAFTISAQPHLLLIKDTWADITSTDTVYVNATSTPVTKEEPAVIMERIAKCEGGGTHYKKDGTLVKNINKNGTIDFGKFQINSHWEDEAVKLGYNIYLPEGNEAFAYHLYHTRGTEDWYSSKACWSK